MDVRWGECPRNALDKDNTNDKEDNEILELLNGLRDHESVPNMTIDESGIDSVPSDTFEVLFDIKKLNDIEDKMIRGIAKKVYMAGKRSSKSSKEVISDIKNAINDSGKMNEEIEKLLSKIL